MKNFNQDLESFVQALAEVGLDKDLEKVGLVYNLDKIGENITTAMVNHLTASEHVYPLPFSLLTTPQLLTIQKFLSEYNFHIEYYSESANIHWYRIWPNWKK